MQNLADLGSHWGPFGEPLGALLGNIGVFFQGLILGHFLVCFWEGPAAGAGLPEASETAELGHISAHARLPLRGGGES